MRVFILEDDPARIAGFKAALIGHETTIRIEVDSAIRSYSPPYDLMLLDHDLGGEFYVSSDDDNTGAEFCRRLRDHFATPEADLTIIHSYNPDGAREMERILKGEMGWHGVHRVLFGKDLLVWLSNQAASPVGSSPQSSDPASSQEPSTS